MKRKNVVYLLISIIFLTLFILILSSCKNSNDSPPDNDQTENPAEFKGPYLGQTLPGNTPEKFAVDFISTSGNEFSCTFSPDGKEFYFTRKVGDDFPIYVTKQIDSLWSEPKIDSCFGPYFNNEPYIALDGNTIFWGTIRTLPNNDSTYWTWFMERSGDTWINPIPLPFSAMYVTMSQDETIYFTTPGDGGACLAKSIPVNGEYLSMQILSEPILSNYWDGHPCISNDGSWMIFDSENRPGTDECSFFITFRNSDKSWSAPQNMNAHLGKGLCAVLSPDGDYIFYSNAGDIYWISSDIVEYYRNN